MKWGFKAQAERISSQVRSELSLDVDAPLNPLELAEHLAIPVFTLEQASTVAPGNSFREYFFSIDPDCFSAVTVFQGLKRSIVHNETHHPNRQASNLSHEISHTLLEHEPTPVADSDGQRFWNPEMEEEATWLGAALLLPRDGVLDMMKSGWSTSEIAAHYGVSDALCKWRITGSGVARQVQRWQNTWRD